MAPDFPVRTAGGPTGGRPVNAANTGVPPRGCGRHRSAVWDVPLSAVSGRRSAVSVALRPVSAALRGVPGAGGRDVGGGGRAQRPDGEKRSRRAGVTRSEGCGQEDSVQPGSSWGCSGLHVHFCSHHSNGNCGSRQSRHGRPAAEGCFWNNVMSPGCRRPQGSIPWPRPLWVGRWHPDAPPRGWAPWALGGLQSPSVRAGDPKSQARRGTAALACVPGGLRATLRAPSTPWTSRRPPMGRAAQAQPCPSRARVVVAQQVA